MKVNSDPVPVWCQRPKGIDHCAFSASLLDPSGSTLAASEANCVVELEVCNVVCYQSLDFKNPFLTVIPRRDVTGMEVTVDWQDQGWGNQKGCLSVRGLVAEFFGPPAPHTRGVYRASVGFEDPVPADRPLDFCFSVGGGGGHTLTIHKLNIRLFTTHWFVDYLSAPRPARSPLPHGEGTRGKASSSPAAKRSRRQCAVGCAAGTTRSCGPRKESPTAPRAPEGGGAEGAAGSGGSGPLPSEQPAVAAEPGGAGMQGNPCAQSGSQRAASQGKTPCAQPGSESAEDQGKMPCAQSGSEEAESQGKSPCAQSGSESAESLGKTPCAQPGSESAEDQGKKPCAQSGSESAESLGKRPCAQPGSESAETQGKMPCTQSGSEKAVSQGKTPCAQSGSESAETQGEKPRASPSRFDAGGGAGAPCAGRDIAVSASRLPDDVVNRVQSYLVEAPAEPDEQCGVFSARPVPQRHSVFGPVTPLRAGGAVGRVDAVPARFDVWQPSSDRVCVKLAVCIGDFQPRMAGDVLCFTIVFERPVHRVVCTKAWVSDGYRSPWRLGLRTAVALRFHQPADTATPVTLTLLPPAPRGQAFELFYTRSCCPTAFDPELTFYLQEEEAPASSKCAVN